MATKAERIEVFYQRLAAVPPASNATEAFELVVSTFLVVEDMLCDEDTDRMQPPSGDFYFEN